MHWCICPNLLSNRRVPVHVHVHVAVVLCCSYTSEAPEMQLRRLADLAMMFQLYELSYNKYHDCKRDFNNDHAWLHFAGATVRARA